MATLLKYCPPHLNRYPWGACTCSQQTCRHKEKPKKAKLKEVQSIGFQPGALGILGRSTTIN